MSHPESGRPQFPVELPPAFAQFLRDQETACLAEATSLGTALIIKLAEADIDSVRGDIPIFLSQQL